MSGQSTSDTKSTSESTNQVPQWVQNAGQANYGLAQQVASQPLQQYQGQMVADTSPQTQQAWNLAANSGNVGQDAQNAAQAGYLNTLSQTPGQVSTGTTGAIDPSQLSKQNLSPYMNPFTQNVIDASLPIMQQNLANSQNQQQNAANSANAFGGSRQAIQQGVTQAQGALGMGQMAAQLNQANFSQAQAAATGDVNAQNQAKQLNQAAQAADYGRSLDAQKANQSAGLTQEQLNNAASSGLGTLGGQQMQNNIANYGMLTSAGGFEQQQDQNNINAQIAKFQQAFQYPQQQLGIMESALGMTPYNTATSGSSNSTTTQTQSNPSAMALGGLQTLGGLFSSTRGRHLGCGWPDGHVVRRADEDGHHQARQGPDDRADDARLPLQGRSKELSQSCWADGAGCRQDGSPGGQEGRQRRQAGDRHAGARLGGCRRPLEVRSACSEPVHFMASARSVDRLKAPGAPILGALGG